MSRFKVTVSERQSSATDAALPTQGAGLAAQGCQDFGPAADSHVVAQGCQDASIAAAAREVDPAEPGTGALSPLSD